MDTGTNEYQHFEMMRMKTKINDRAARSEELLNSRVNKSFDRLRCVFDDDPAAAAVLWAQWSVNIDSELANACQFFECDDLWQASSKFPFKLPNNVRSKHRSSQWLINENYSFIHFSTSQEPEWVACRHTISPPPLQLTCTCRCLKHAHQTCQMFLHTQT